MRVLVALGGNALLQAGRADDRGRPASQRPGRRARALAPVAEHHQLVLSHGNGPQVGLLALQAAGVQGRRGLPARRPRRADRGHDRLHDRAGARQPAARPRSRSPRILTMIEVDADDPAFADPTKFVGPVYDAEQAGALADEKGWVFKRDGSTSAASCHRRSRSGSSRSARSAGCSSTGTIVICAGGGGIPTMWVARPGAHARRRRGRDRQGPRERAARPRGRRRPVRDGDRRRRRLRGLGHARAAAARRGHARGAAAHGLRRRVDGAEGRGRRPLRRGDRQARRHRLARGHREDRRRDGRHERRSRSVDLATRTRGGGT